MTSAQTRRSFMAGGCACMLFAGSDISALRCFAAEPSEIVGCSLFGDDAPAIVAQIEVETLSASDTGPLIPRSSDPNLNLALALGLQNICEIFDVWPGFAFFDGPKSITAIATPTPLLHRRDGTVLFGLNLLSDLLARSENRDLAIMAVCAHEFGHIVAYKQDINRLLSPDPRRPFRSEQFADFMAGYFAGRRRAQNANYPAVAVAETLYTYGSQTASSHGTPMQRGNAVQKGFISAYYKQLDRAGAIKDGFDFAMAQ